MPQESAEDDSGPDTHLLPKGPPTGIWVEGVPPQPPSQWLGEDPSILRVGVCGSRWPGLWSRGLMVVGLHVPVGMGGRRVGAMVALAVDTLWWSNCSVVLLGGWVASFSGR